jgi:Zn-dependent M32 family carboxypeptidase
MTKNVLIGILLALLAYQAHVIVRVENERYAMLTGVCKRDSVTGLWDEKCLQTMQTRTAWWGHLYYAIVD